MSAMVGEFPELQGIMGRYYAEAQGEPEEVARAIEEHYRPRYAGDALPVTRSGQALSLADKIDTLVGIFAIEQRPTGTKDPFGLRRAALGVLRILLECRLDLDLHALLRASATDQPVLRPGVGQEVYDFIAERLRGLLLERADGTSPEMLDAVLALGRIRRWTPLRASKRSRRSCGCPKLRVLTAINKRIVQHPAQGAAALRHGAGIGVHRRRRAWRYTQAVTDSSGAVGAGPARAALRRSAARLTALSGRRSTISSITSWSWTRIRMLRSNRLALLAKCTAPGRRRGSVAAAGLRLFGSGMQLIKSLLFTTYFMVVGVRARGLRDGAVLFPALSRAVPMARGWGAVRASGCSRTALRPQIRGRGTRATFLRAITSS